MNILSRLVFYTILLVLPILVNGQQFVQTKIVSPPDAEEDDRFGASVDICNGRAIISATRKTDGTNQTDSTGMAFIYEKENGLWVLKASLSPPEGEGQEAGRFGFSVSIDGDQAVVGAYPVPTEPGPGTAFVFERVGGNWTYITELVNQTPTNFDAFGTTVSISGNTILIGASNSEFGPGKVFAYEKSGGVWNFDETLQPADLMGVASFGNDVVIDGNMAVIGANASLSNQGASYIFQNIAGVWTEVQQLTASDGMASDFFGSSVDISGDLVLISSLGANMGAGTCYVFRNVGGSWIENQVLTVQNIPGISQLGYGVAISDQYAVVTSPWVNNALGVAYVFVNTGGVWIENQTLMPTQVSEFGQYGWSVALCGDDLLVGAISGQDLMGAELYPGLGYFYEFIEFIPTLSQWGIIILGIFMLILGVSVVRNRRVSNLRIR